MKKSEQIRINENCKRAIERYNYIMAHSEVKKVKRLRSCSAHVLITDEYYTLRSYNTVVAFIDRETDTLYDILRYVYGYTSTSAQHISKFESDYCKGKWNCEHSFRYYNINNESTLYCGL